MNPFLEDIARYVYDTYRNNLREVCLVFPNRRAGLFFDHYLAGIIDRPVLKPAVTTISDFMRELSGLRYADDLDLLFDLFRVYIAKKKSRETFDEFYQWGEILLADFDDVDKYLVNAADLFSNLASLKEMDRKFDYLTTEQVEVIRRFWKSFDPAHPGVHQERFISAWEVLYPVYSGLKEILLQKGAGYEGLVYRTVAEKIRAGDAPVQPGQKIILAGFNALNACEEVLFSHLKKTGNGVFLWDYDEYYLGDSIQEAGHFITRYLKEYPPPQINAGFRNIESGTKDIRIYSVPSDVGQASLAGDILQQLPGDPANAFHDTAVVLADEHLLMPVLYALPEKISTINVTMGYPVSQTPVNSFIELLFRLLRNARISKGLTHYYFKDILALLGHQLIQHIFPEDNRQLRESVGSGNLIFVPAGQLRLNGLFGELFPDGPVNGNIPARLAAVLEKITACAREQEASVRNFDLEFICHIYLRLKRLNDILVANNASLSVDTFGRLYRKSIGSSRVPFIGEPLSGIQIMGVLETRLLDFKNVIMLSLNEGYFPRTSVSPSFIPHYLRHAFGMPDIEHRDAIYAYYFYRLLQRAESVFLVYNSNTGGAQKGERSRYIYQLQYDPLFHAGQVPVGMDVRSGPPVPLVIHKKSWIMEKLATFYADEGKPYLSPSALNAYMECSLSFFFRYMAGLKEAEVKEEEIDPLAFGNILHASVAGLYSRTGSAVLQAEDLNRLLESEALIREGLDKAFSENFPAGNLSAGLPAPGTNILVREVLYEYVRNIIREDMKHVPLTLVEQEQQHIMVIPVATPGGLRQIRIGGRIDRVDATAGITRIIDYKSGSADTDFGDTAQLFARNDESRNKAAFQVLLYCRLYLADNPAHRGLLVPGLYIVREMHEGTYEYRLKTGEKGKTKMILPSFRDVSASFDTGLLQLLQEIYDPAVPFTPTGDEKSCVYCPYAGLCYRNRNDDR